jgi:hypothetical protein
MGSDPEARIGYGYDLGSGTTTWRIANAPEYGLPELPWLVDDDFTESLGKHLLTTIGGFTETDFRAEGYFKREEAAKQRIGVRLDQSGTWDYPGHILVAINSRQAVEWADTLTLDLEFMLGAGRLAKWDGQLDAALSQLGLQPTQDRPRWLVYPFYG